MAGDMDLSLVVRGDASGAKAAADTTTAALNSVDKAQRESASAAEANAVANERQAASSGKAATGARATVAAQTEAMRAMGGGKTAALELGAAEEKLARTYDAAITGARAAASAKLGVGAANVQAAQQTSASAGKMAEATLALEVAQGRAALAANALSAAEAKVGAAASGSAAQQQAAAAQLEAATVRVAAANLNVIRAQGKLGPVVEDTSKAVARQGYALRNVGQQFGDFGLQVAGGADVARAFGQQAGQLGFALSEMGGKLGKIGTFLTGPWGIALTIGAAVLAPLVEKLFDGAKAADDQADKLAKASQAADSYGTAQSLLGKVIDLTTGKLKTQNQVLIQTIKLQAQANILKAQADQKTAAEALKDAGQQTTYEGVVSGLRGTARSLLSSGSEAGQEARDQAAALAPLNKVLGDYVELTRRLSGSTESAAVQQDALNRGLDSTQKRIDALAKAGKLGGRDPIAVKQLVLGLGTTINDQKANQEVVDAINGGKLSSDLVPYARAPKPKAPPKPKKVAADTATPREAEEIERINEQYDRQPTLIDKAAQATRRLDVIIGDLTKRKPPGFEKLIADANTAKGAIQDGLQRPYEDYLLEQSRGLEVQKLLSQGRYDEANALREVQQLERTMGPLTLEQKDAVLATVQAMRQEADAIDDLREKNRKYIEALGSIRGIVEDATQAFVRGDLGQLIKSPGKLLDAFATLKGRKLFDDVFGGVFKDLENQLNGVDPVKDASQRMADAVDAVSTQTDKTTKALDRLAEAADRAASGTTAPTSDGLPASASGGLAVVGAVGDFLGKSATSTNSIVEGDRPAPDMGDSGDIVVSATRLRDASKSFLSATDLFNTAGKRIGGKIDELIDPKGSFFQGLGASLGSALEGASAGGIVGSTFGSTGTSIGRGIGGLAGLFKDGSVLGKTGIGGSISGISSSISAGLPQLALASQANQAIGKIFGFKGGPLGVFTSLFEGIFKKEKNGSSTLQIANGQATAGTATGKGSEARQQASVLGGSLADGLNSIASTLGLSLGSANVSIGYRPGHSAPAYRVDPTGKGAVAGGSVQSFETEQEAVSFALRDAIADGAILGLSAAMQRAINANPDIDKALQEALKVKDLETLIGGVGSSLKAQFAEFDQVAADRVNTAKKYGLDLIAVERINGEERAKLVDDALKTRIGSLSDFLESLKFGDLSEGTAVDKRAGLIAQIKTTQADAEAGKDGAADKLAQLLQQLTTSTRENFGTAGAPYSDDRALGQSAAERVIQQETDRVNSAAGIGTATVTAIAETNKLTGETNDLLAVNNTRLEQLIAAQGGAPIGVGTGGSTISYSNVLRGRELA